MSYEVLVDGTTFAYRNTPAGVALLVEARIAAARRLWGA
jgi:hypothetical protein